MWKILASLCLVLSPVSAFAEHQKAGAIPVLEESQTQHSLILKAKLNEVDGKVTLLSTSVTPITVPADSIRGKPYLIVTFPAGFSPGNDPAIDYQWGYVADDLSYGFTTPAHYKNGPYDAVFVVYVNTPITDEIRNGDPIEAPVPVKGDLSSFTADTSVVLGDDPALSNGVVRLNVRDSDASIEISNRLPASANFGDLFKAMTNTVMIVP